MGCAPAEVGVALGAAVNGTAVCHEHVTPGAGRRGALAW